MSMRIANCQLLSLIVAVVVFAGSVSHGAIVQINETFDSAASAAAHGWTALNNTVPNNSFGHSATNNTGATPAGEAGGVFNRLSTTAYYADTDTVESLLRTYPIQASGELDITSISSSFDNNVFVGHLDSTGTTLATVDFLGMQISELTVGNTTSVRAFATVRYSNGTAVLGNQLTLTSFPNSDRLWSYTFNPTGGPDSVGQLVLTINGAGGGVSTLNLTAAHAGLNFSLNAFGISAPGFGGVASTNLISLFIDNVTYSQIAVPEPSTLALALVGIGLVAMRRRRNG